MASETHAAPHASVIHHDWVWNRQGLRNFTRALSSRNHCRMDFRSRNFLCVELQVYVDRVVCYLPPKFSLSRIFVFDMLEPNPPRQFSFFFESDLIRAACRLLFTTSPNYRSDEIRTPEPLHGLHPPITGYRLLTCLFVVLFGVTKAYLAYQDLSSGANALDWIYGTIVISW